MKTLFKNLTRNLLIIALAGLWSMGASAEPDKRWDELTPQERQVLERTHAERWNSKTPEERERMLKGAERWQKMTPEEREKARARHEKFKNMSPEEKAQMRERHEKRREAFEKLPPEKQQAIRDCKKRKHAGEDIDCRSLMPERPKS